MDSGNVAIMVLGSLFLVGVSIVGIISPQFFWSLSAWRYRNADAMEPTEAQYSLHRLRYAALLTLWVPILVGAFWPGEGEAKLTAGVVSAVVAVGIMIAVIVIRAVIRRRSQRSTIDHDRPSELSSLGYSAEWLAIGYTLFYVLLIVGIIVGIHSSFQNRQDARESDELTAAERQEILDMVENLTPRYTPPTVVEVPAVPVYTAVPDGLYVGAPLRAQVNAEGVFRTGAYTTPCPLVGVVVIESSVNVSVGLAYDPAPAVAAGAEPAAFCVRDSTKTIQLTPVPITLGERVLLTLDGSKLIVGQY